MQYEVIAVQQSDVTASPTVTPVVIEASEEMKALPRWVNWRYETGNGGKPTKPLFQPNGYRASHSDPATWSTHEEVVTAVENPANDFEGIGWVIAAPYAGVDFDHVRNPETGEVNPVAMKQIAALDSYAEVSPSGTGVHVLVRGRLEAAGRKKPHVEVYDQTRYFTFTGAHLTATPITINSREAELRSVYSNIEAINAALTPLIITDKFTDLMHGDWQAHYPGVSGAVQGLLCMLAVKYNCDRSKMDEEFRASGLYADHSPDHADWVEKWERLSESELDKAIAFILKHQHSESKALSIGDFTKPAVYGGAFDFIFAPLPNQIDGWFPRGDISCIGGSSGSMKSTLLFDLLRRQRNCETVLGHNTFGLRFLVLMADRGTNGNIRTLARMKIDPKAFPLKPIEASSVETALQEIKHAVEADQIPAVVFLEGSDMLLEDASKMGLVAPFLRELRKLAEHYHIAFVLSVGAPKMKSRDQYVAKRDTLFGSVAWGRMTETIMTMQYPNGDDLSNHRELYVQLRNAPPESFSFVIKDGLLEKTYVELDPPVKDDLNTWIFSQKGWFTIQAASVATHTVYKTAARRLQALYQSKLLELNPDTKNKLEYRVASAVLMFTEGDAQ